MFMFFYSGFDVIACLFLGFKKNIEEQVLIFLQNNNNNNNESKNDNKKKLDLKFVYNLV